MKKYAIAATNAAETNADASGMGSMQTKATKARSWAVTFLALWTCLMALVAVGLVGLTQGQLQSMSADDWIMVARVALWGGVWLMGTIAIAAVTLIVRLGREDWRAARKAERAPKADVKEEVA